MTSRGQTEGLHRAVERPLSSVDRLSKVERYFLEQNSSEEMEDVIKLHSDLSTAKRRPLEKTERGRRGDYICQDFWTLLKAPCFIHGPSLQNMRAIRFGLLGPYLRHLALIHETTPPTIGRSNFVLLVPI